ATAATPTETSKNATRNYELDRTLQHTRQPAGRVKRVSVAVLVDHVPRPGANGKLADQPLSAAELTRVEALVKQAVGFDAERGDTVSVMNAPFVRDVIPVEEPVWWQQWWENPQFRDALRLVLGAVVVLALLFGVLRPALRQIAGPAKAAGPMIGEDPLSANVQVVEDENGLPMPSEDRLQLGAASPLALPLDAYEERVRMAREAVQADSKRVAQVVRGWVAND
ncbi:MAG: flagellar M-ring protein FliF C-terminal domain-containing protein, partial [Stenotrophomonas sp.]